MDSIIKSTLNTLLKTEILLNNLSSEDLCNVTIPPYYSSIGSHVRHILDFYNCIFYKTSENKLDLTIRSKNKALETNCECAQNYLEQIVEKLKETTLDVNETVIVIDDLGLGKTEVLYTYGALLAQANSHTIHHYAIINYILNSLGIVFNDSEFGYNPTTLKQEKIIG